MTNKCQNRHNLLHKEEAKLCGLCGVTLEVTLDGAGKQLQGLEEARMEGRAGMQTDRGASCPTTSWLWGTLYPQHLASSGRTLGLSTAHTGPAGSEMQP